ncbi:MAG: hypothetical protein ACO3UM_14350, partial [Planctomycetota bacterium]
MDRHDRTLQHGPTPHPIPETTLAVLRASRFRIDPEPWTWNRAGRVDHPGLHRIVIRDELGTTVVSRGEALAHVEVLARNPDAWCLLTIDCAHPFDCIG